MTAKLGQYSFNGGIWSTILNGRTDFEKYKSAVNRLENFIVWPHGPASFRPGFKFIAGTKTNSLESILIPFEFSVTQAYMIEAGNNYFRFYKNQSQIESAPGVPYEVFTPYGTDDIDELKWCQSADVLYLFHPDYNTRKLSRTGDTSWDITEINWRPGPISVQPIYPDATLLPGATTGTDITFTASVASFIDGDVGRLIISGIGRASITSFTSSTVVVCDIIDDFSAAVNINPSDWFMLGSPYAGLRPSRTEPVGSICTLTGSGIEKPTIVLNTKGEDYWALSGSGSNEYYLKNTAVPYSASKPGAVFFGYWGQAQLKAIEVLPGLLTGGNYWAWGDNDGLGYDTIYYRTATNQDPDDYPSTGYLYSSGPELPGSMFRSTDVGRFVRINNGIIKITEYTSASSVNGIILKDLDSIEGSSSWTLESEMWNEENGYPRAGTFFEERLCAAGSYTFPETVWGSSVGDYENHSYGIEDSDAIQFSVIGRRLNTIRWIEPADYLIVGTIGGEWRLGPEDTGSPLTPLNVVAKQTTTNGCADIQPITVDGSTLFVQKIGRKIRELTFDFAKGESGGYLAPDLTQLAEHLTKGGVSSFDYQQEPFSTIWATVTGANLIGLTYLRNEDVLAWHEHPMRGTDVVERVASIPGDGYNELWAIVKRSVNGVTVRYVECMQKVFTDDADTYESNKGLNAFHVDAGITYNGVSTTTIIGLDHLEGEDVCILADGALQNNKTVNLGQITLETAATIVHVGLPYTGLIETLNINADMQDGTSHGREKRIIDMIVKVNDSGVFKVGRDEDNLDTIQDPEISLVYGEGYPLYSGDLNTRYEGDYDKEVKMFIVQDRPMPFTLLSISPEVEIT